MSSVVYDYSLLRGKIVEKFGSIGNFVEHMREKGNFVTYVQFSKKMNNKNGFVQCEIDSISKVLDIPESEIYEYFFRKQVGNN